MHNEHRPSYSAKFVVAGGFGVGKTTFVNSISEIEPLTTEAALTEDSADIDRLVDASEKTTTTVALDYGRRTIDESLVLYLFGTPGQHRFWGMWDTISIGAVGAIVLVDTSRHEASFPAIDYFEHRSLPFVVAVNDFDGAAIYDVEDIRAALVVAQETPIIRCDARDEESCRNALVNLVDHALEKEYLSRRVTEKEYSPLR